MLHLEVGKTREPGSIKLVLFTSEEGQNTGTLVSPAQRTEPINIGGPL